MPCGSFRRPPGRRFQPPGSETQTQSRNDRPQAHDDQVDTHDIAQQVGENEHEKSKNERDNSPHDSRRFERQNFSPASPLFLVTCRFNKSQNRDEFLCGSAHETRGATALSPELSPEKNPEKSFDLLDGSERRVGSALEPLVAVETSHAEAAGGLFLCQAGLQTKLPQLDGEGYRWFHFDGNHISPAPAIRQATGSLFPRNTNAGTVPAASRSRRPLYYSTV